MESYIDRETSHFMLNVLKDEGFHLRQIAKITGIDYHKLTRARNNEFELKESDFRKVVEFYDKHRG